MSDDALFEHRAALARIDDAVARAAALAGDALSCHRGCSSCCVAGLTVLPVEAALLEEALAAPAAAANTSRADGLCPFLDDDGACVVYAARPVLCRTHGLALRAGRTDAGDGGAGDGPGQRGLRVLGDDVSACALNYTTRAPAGAEVLDATKILALLVTVDRRYRARVGLPDDTARVPLAALAARAAQ